MVVFNGASYLAATTSLGSEPDVSPAQWAVLAVNGAVGATGPSGVAATVSVGSVTTGAAGSQASVTNSGTASAAVLNFTIPQGAAGVGGSGTEVEGRAAFRLLRCFMRFRLISPFYSVNSANSSAGEDRFGVDMGAGGLYGVAVECVFAAVEHDNVKLRQGMPGSMADTGLGMLGGFGIVMHGDGECGDCGGRILWTSA